MNKWIPAGLGAEPKKVAFLVVLVVLLPVAYWFGNSSDVPATTTPTRSSTAPVVPPASAPRPATPAPARSSTRARSGGDDFHPSLKLPEDFDLSKVDPTLRTDLLTRVREVAVEGGSRSLFEFYTPPPPPPPKVEPIKPQAPKPPPVVAETKPAAPAEPVKPPPPPIPLKYYGYEGVPRAGSRLRAWFVDGEDVFAAGENEMIRNRYRIVRIGATSAEIEDTVAKNTQTLRILDRCEDSSAGCK